jgi:hypothetical protein
MTAFSKVQTHHWFRNRSAQVVFSIGLVLGFTSCARAAPTECTRDDAIKAEAEASSLKTWSAVLGSYKRYKQCDDGAIAEGYSASVAYLLASRWADTETLVKQSNNDPEFLRFVIRHVDETMNINQGKSIKNSAATNCPANAKKLCGEIQRRFEELGFYD